MFVSDLQYLEQISLRCFNYVSVLSGNRIASWNDVRLLWHLEDGNPNSFKKIKCLRHSEHAVASNVQLMPTSTTCFARENEQETSIDVQ